eukprot:gb/GFBE01079245.1/.p1 GENE.gb/GFBE01079245.1/~~gb/GFBE01079245.1/.p1  ORF type:complete len:297 (+),score=40.41 gb/GFBE01079245.1/:1-891(+)
MQERPQRDACLDSIISKLCETVEQTFGTDFIIFNDFWSWRADKHVAVEKVHMDADFWATGGDDGFNLWILLDHCEMPYTFDIYPKDENLDLYKLARLPGSPSWLLPETDASKAKECPGMIFWHPISRWPVVFEWSTWARAFGIIGQSLCAKWWIKTQALVTAVKNALPTWAFRGLMFFVGWMARLSILPAGIELKKRRFDIEVGDAFVVRQQEWHGTDKGPLKSGQYRLAIEFKFMRRAAATQYAYLGPSPKLRRTFRSSRLPLGKNLTDLYCSTGIDMKLWEVPSILKPLLVFSV